ncbi:MAG: PKD domain-containing protein [Chitinophagaceae bacterium]
MQKAAVAQLHADFTSSQVSGCAPVYVEFTDKSTGGATSWKWDPGNGTTSLLQNPATTYFNPGKYSIKLVIKKGALADSIVKESLITVNALPKPLFKVSDTTGCYPLKVNFTDQSLAQEGNIIKWEWDLGDGSLSSLQNPSFIYKNPGMYNVALRVTNSAGCVATVSKEQYIKIKDGINASYTFSGNNSQCAPPSVIHFTNTSTGTGTMSYQWFFGDGNTSTLENPSNSYTNTGLYTIQLIVKNNVGCVDTLIKKDSIAIGAAHAMFTGPDSVCQNMLAQFTNTSQPATGKLQWSFGNNSFSTDEKANTTYATPGVYNVKLIADFGACKDSLTKPVKVLPAVKADFTADQTVSCKIPFNVLFKNLSPVAVSYQWFFGDSTSSTLPNPTHTYTKAGAFDVTLITTNSNGCTDTLQQKKFVTVSPAVIKIDDLPVTGCAPLTFAPSYSVSSLVPIASYKWNFGDGTTSTSDAPSHIYTQPGSYTVTLTYTTINGCTDSIVYKDAVRAGQKPKASFTATPTNACASTPIMFTDNSTGTITNYLWYFGDGVTDTSRNPTHLYNDTGYFSITLIVSNNGCTDTLRKPNYVYIKPPIAKFAVDVQCADPFNFAFTNYSIGAVNWTWDFGDGTSSTVLNPTHKYINKGNYVVKLTATNGSCIHTAAYGARIIQEKADFAADKTVVCKNDSVTFTPTGFNRSNIAAYKWSSDGKTDTAYIFKTAYKKSGKYTVQLIITNISGCRDTMTKTDYIIVNGPTADFKTAASAVCLKDGGTMQFTDMSATDGTHAITKWAWDFGDNAVAAAASPAHTYGKEGYYTVALKVTDTEGCTDSINKANQVYIANPKAAFSSNDTMSCQNKPVAFINQSAGQSLQYSWSFGDNSSSTTENPVHNYTVVGLYNVSLKIKDTYGCTDSIYKPGYLRIDEPKALFKISDSTSTCPPLVVNFTNQSKYYKQISWDFGDGTGSLVDNPVHYYNYPGIYYPKLVVVSPGGCTDTIYKRIEIKGPTGVLQYDKTSACNPGTVNFTAVSQNATSFIWDFNDGATANTGNPATNHTYTDPGTYIPRMILQDSRGCKVPIPGKDTIRIYGVSAFFSKDKNILCDQGLIHFTDSSLSNDLITDYTWTMGDGSTTQERNPAHNYTATGIYDVKLVVTTLNGCKDSASLTAAVKVVSSPKVSIKGDSGACVPARLTFNGILDAPDTSALAWKWDFSNNNSAIQQNPQPVSYPNDGVFNAVMSVTNSSGCETKVVKPVTIHPLPMVDAGKNTAICEKKTATLEATGADKYTWIPAQSLSCTNCANPVASPDSTIMYKVNGETIFGCKGSDSVIITVKHPFRMQIGKGDTLCKGESFHLSATNAELYDWTPSTSLDNSHIKSPLARPGQTTDYQVIGRDSVGCYADTGHIKLVVYGFPTVDAGPDKTISVGSSTELNAKISSDAISIKWQPSTGLSCTNCPNPVANPKQTTLYSLVAINEGGCVSKDDISLFVVCNNGNIFMPNTFSPNGDGTNDVFYPRGTGLYNIRSMRIFNRWGEPVFEGTNFNANDAAKGWKGDFKGKPAPNDVYVYFVEVICENNSVIMYSGNITLIR